MGYGIIGTIFKSGKVLLYNCSYVNLVAKMCVHVISVLFGVCVNDL